MKKIICIFFSIATLSFNSIFSVEARPATDTFLAYLSSLIEQKKLSEEELISLIEHAHNNIAFNPISNLRAQTSTSDHIAHSAIDKLLDGNVDRSQIHPWVIERISQEAKKKIKRTDTENNTEQLAKVRSPLACGEEHSCAIQANNSVTCWGRNDHGQSSPPKGLAVIAVSPGYRHTCAVKVDDTVACWGYNVTGECNVPDSLGTVAFIGAGYYHTCAIKSDGDVACWGDNSYSQSNPPENLAPVIAIFAKEKHTCAITVSGDVDCWGYNYHGQSSPPANLKVALSNQ